MNEDVGTGIITCDICNDYQGDANQLKGHKPHCQRAKEAEKLQAELSEASESMPDNKLISDEPVKPARARPAPDRKERVPFGSTTQKLGGRGMNDGFHYRTFNDNWAHDPNRIQRARDAGYEVVEGAKRISVGTNSDSSSITGILMRIPQEFYDEDQDKKLQPVREIQEMIKSGTFKQEQGDGRYVPPGIINIESNNREPT